MAVDELVHRKCPVCGGDNTEFVLQKAAVHLVRCLSCSMVYANPISSELAAGSFYDRAGDEYLSPEKLESDYAEVRFERELRLFRTYSKNGSILDVGCSSGAFLYQLKRRFPNDYNVLGTDVSSAPLEHAAKMGVPVIKKDFLAQSFDIRFDAVTFWAVMEHLSEPGRFLQKAASILKPGGLCFVLTPNMGSLAVRILGTKYRYILQEHVNYFTASTLRKFVESEFTIHSMQSTHFNPLVIWQDWRGPEREVSRAERSKLLKRTTAYKQARWMLPAKFAYRLTEGLLGRFSMADNISIVGRKE